MGRILGGGKELTRDHWFEDIADHLSSAYLRYSFTKGTIQEVDFILEETKIAEGSRILDVGCGPGRHTLEFARRGFTVEGIDISEEFIDLANASADAEDLTNAIFTRMDARMLCDDHTRDASFDLVICLCQGAFGLMRSPDDDQRVFAGLSSVLRPGGALVLSAFNAYFQVRHHIDATFDAATGVSHERTSVRNPDGIAREVDLWTGCYTPKELGALARHNGVAISQMYGVEPGGYGRSAPSIDLPEILLVGHRQPGAGSV